MGLVFTLCANDGFSLDYSGRSTEIYLVETHSKEAIFDIFGENNYLGTAIPYSSEYAIKEMPETSFTCAKSNGRNRVKVNAKAPLDVKINRIN